MKKMAKLLALMLALVMVLALFAGCSGEEEKPAETTKAAETEGNETKEEPEKTDAPTTEPQKEVVNQIIYGSTTELSGDLGNAWWTNNAADKTLRDLIDE